MIKKTFVSLFFSPQSIQVLQLDSKRKKVLIRGLIKLPDKLITDHKIQDEAVLASYIGKFWKEQKIKEKFVGMVIPEFSTLIKNLTLPKVEHSELDEAVHWQVQDFFPWKPSNTILDWKILEETGENFQIITVATRKQVLTSYVKAVRLAGLFPIVVETPSLSLSRLSSETPSEGKLIYYASPGEKIFVVAKGQKIFGSSAVSLENQEDLLTTAKRIVSHYKEVEIKKVEVGGLGVKKELIKALQEAFNRPVKPLTYQVSGLTNEGIQEYLIPLSLQLKDPAEPADEKTVNLLPPQLVKKYEKKRLKLQVWSLSLFATYLIWISFFAALAAYLYLGQQISTLRASQVELVKKNPEAVELVAQIQKVNTLAKKTILITNSHVYPQKIVNAINQAKPDKVLIKRFEVDTDKGTINLLAKSADRQSLLTFTQKLEENGDFSLVELPISSLEVEKDLEFFLTFNYLPLSAERKTKKK